MPLHPTYPAVQYMLAMFLVLPRAVWELHSRTLPHSLVLSTAAFKLGHYSVALTLSSQSRAVGGMQQREIKIASEKSNKGKLSRNKQEVLSGRSPF